MSVRYLATRRARVRGRLALRPRHVLSALVLTLMLAASALAGAREVPLIEAAKTGTPAAVRALLKQGSDVNTTLPDGTTALHWAAHRGDASLVDLLIRAGAKVSLTNRYGVAPLSLACTNGHGAIVEHLLKAGADPNTTLPGGETAVMTAARSGSVQAVTALTARGAQVNAREATRGQTALMWAAAEGHAEVITALLKAGADLKATSHGPPGADFTHSSDAQKRPMPRIDVFTAFLFAVRAGHVEAVRVLLEAGADVNETAKDGKSALTIAIANAKYDLAGFLLEKGADPNLASPEGWTPLYQLVRTRNLNINYIPHPEPEGRLGSLDVAKELLRHGAKVNVRLTRSIADGYRGGTGTQVGASPFLMAAKGADATMMRLLAASGADPSVPNMKGTTPLMVAAGVEMQNLNEDSGTNEEALAAAVVALDLGADVNAANDAGETALHGAVWRDAGALIQLLVDRGARLDVKNKKGFTPWQFANGEDVQISGAPVRPASIAVLRKAMTERGLPTPVKSSEDIRATAVAPKPQ